MAVSDYVRPLAQVLATVFNFRVAALSAHLAKGVLQKG